VTLDLYFTSANEFLMRNEHMASERLVSLFAWSNITMTCCGHTDSRTVDCRTLVGGVASLQANAVQSCMSAGRSDG
jgi:hypothetical protein